MVTLILVAGIVSPVLATLMWFSLTDGMIGPYRTIIFSPLVEELFKFFAVGIALKQRGALVGSRVIKPEYYRTAVIYAVVAALSFALTENTVWFLGQAQGGLAHIAAIRVVPTLGHVLYGALLMFGWFGKRPLAGLALATLAHLSLNVIALMYSHLLEPPQVGYFIASFTLLFLISATLHRLLKKT